MECRSRHRVDYDFISYDILTSDFFALLWNQRGSLNIPTLSRVLCSFCKWKWDNNIKWNLPPVFSWNVHLSSTVFLFCLSQSESNNQPMKRCVTFHFSICTKIWLDEDTLPWNDHVILLGQVLGIYSYSRHRWNLCKIFNNNNYSSFPHHRILFQSNREKHDLRSFLYMGNLHIKTIFWSSWNKHKPMVQFYCWSSLENDNLVSLIWC